MIFILRQPLSQCDVWLLMTMIDYDWYYKPKGILKLGINTKNIRYYKPKGIILNTRDKYYKPKEYEPQDKYNKS